MEVKQVSRCAEIEDDLSINIIDLEEVVYAYYKEGDNIAIRFKNGKELTCPFANSDVGNRIYKAFAKQMIEYKKYANNRYMLI